MRGKIYFAGALLIFSMVATFYPMHAEQIEWKVAEGVISWAYTLDTIKLSNGVHTIEARAYDGKDYSNIASITVNVQNEKEERIPRMIIGITVAIVAIVAIAIYYLRRAKAK